MATILAALKVNIWVFLVLSASGDPSLTPEQLNQLLQRAASKYSEVGVNANFQQVRIIKDQFPYLAALEQQNQRYLRWNQWAHRKGYKRPRRLVHFIFSPMRDLKTGTYGWLGGLGALCSYRSRLGIQMSNAAIETPYGNREYHSAYALNHESGHGMGMKHLSGDNIMNTTMYAIMQRLGINVPWFNQSLTDAIKCTTRPYAKTKHRKILEPTRL